MQLAIAVVETPPGSIFLTAVKSMDSATEIFINGGTDIAYR